jgi:hypothetical protein
MSGYTPVFSSVLDGTLYGRWPHTGIWMCLLSQCDRNGNIDMVPGLLAAKIGVPVALLVECIADFMKPDPGSRTGDLDGKRLELIDSASREWGWHVINHSLYRERARKQAYDAKRTASGDDANRKRENRQSLEPPTRPAKSRVLPLSNANSNANSNSNANVRGDARGEPRATRSAATRLPKDYELTDDRKAYASAQGIDPAATFENFRDYWTAAGGAKARKHDWDATWRMWCRNQADRKTQADRPRKTRYAQLTERLEARINANE